MTLNNRTFTLLKIVLLIIISIFIAEIIVLPKIEHDMLQEAGRQELVTVQQICGAVLENYPDVEQDFILGLRQPTNSLQEKGEQILKQYGYDEEHLLADNTLYAAYMIAWRNWTGFFLVTTFLLLAAALLYFYSTIRSSNKEILLILEQYLSEDFSFAYISSLNNYFELYGGMAIFIVVLLEYMNLPGFPAGIIMPLAGIYAAHGGISLLAAIAISVLAGEVGSWILYFLGMYGGNAFLKIYLKRFPKHKPAFERTFDLIRRKGFYGIFISKLIPMVRTLISIPAGVLKMEFIKYSIASFLGVTLWNTLFVGAGYIIGEPILKIITRG